MEANGFYSCLSSMWNTGRIILPKFRFLVKILYQSEVFIMIYTSLCEKPLCIFLNIQSVCFQKRRAFVDNIEVLDEEIVYQNGPFVRIKRWLRGMHPTLGTLMRGLTGWETLVEKDVIRPTGTFYIHENNHDTDQAFLRRTDSQCFEPTYPQEISEPFGMVGDAIPSDQGSSSALV